MTQLAMADDMRLIAVQPKHYRAIALEAIAAFPGATIWVEKRLCPDLSESGLLTQRGIGGMRDFEIRSENNVPILGFHDHPREMWVDGQFKDLADRLDALGHLRIERSACISSRPVN